MEGPYVIKLEGVLNTRNIGGFVTQSGKMLKAGLLFRSAQMDAENAVTITEKGILTATEELKIKTDLDLRKTEQVPFSLYEKNVGPLGKGVRHVHYVSKEYCEFIKGESNEGDIMRVFADVNNYPILFHCVWGADRTGTVAYLLEMLAGVELEDRLKDYEITGSRDRNNTGLQAMISYIEENFDGNTDEEKAYGVFSKNFALTEMEISNIKNILLTDSAVFSAESLKTSKLNENGEYKFKLIMRSSKSIKSVQYDNKNVEFSFDDGILSLYGINPLKCAVGTILLDDENELRFAF